MERFLVPSVVAGVDGSAASTRALDVAAAEAALRHWPLRVVHVTKHPRGRDDVVVTARARAEDTAPVLRIGYESMAGSPAAVLSRLAGASGIVVVGARGLGAVGSLLLGSTSHALVSDAPCPVVVVRTTIGRPTGRVVVGICRHVPTEVVGFAFDEASRRGAELLAVHAWETAVHFTEALRRSPAEARQEHMGQEQEVIPAALAPWEVKYPDVAVRRVVSTDSPASLIEEWSAGADLAVVGRGSLSRPVAPEIGSTVYAVLHGSACPVAVVPAP